MSNKMVICGRTIGINYKPFVIAEIGINHEGSLEKAKYMIDKAHEVGCECVKFQSHIIEDEMSSVAKNVVPGNADVSIWDIMSRCTLTEEEEMEIKRYTEEKGMIFLSTPFSRAAAERLNRMGVEAYKIGSGECNNYPLVEHIARFGKPIILSTGMNTIESIQKSVAIMEKYKVPYALLHCTSIYPTPYEQVRLGAIQEMQKAFPKAVIGISDHTISPYPVLGAVALGASIIERHFTADKNWPGPDIEISMDPIELKQIIEASEIIWKSSGGSKGILEDEQVTIDFAYATVVSIKDIREGDILTRDNLWVKRPGTGEIMAESYETLLGKKVNKEIKCDTHLRWEDICE